MGTEIVVQKSFEEKMKERIKESIGELITDEELCKLVDRAVEEVFFKERTKSGRNTWESPKYEPPFLHEIIKELLNPIVDKYVSNFIDKHPQEVMNAIKEVVSLGMGTLLLNAVTNKFQTELSTFQMNIQDKLNTLSQH